MRVGSTSWFAASEQGPAVSAIGRVVGSVDELSVANNGAAVPAPKSADSGGNRPVEESPEQSAVAKAITANVRRQ